MIQILNKSFHSFSTIGSPSPILLSLPKEVLLHFAKSSASESHHNATSDISSSIPSPVVFPASHLWRMIPECWILKLSQLLFMNLLDFFRRLKRFQVFQNLGWFFYTHVVLGEKFLQNWKRFLLESNGLQNVRYLQV